MQLTRFSDYSIRLLVLLALNDGQAITVAAAAEHLGISKNHLIKVANLLVRAGYLLAVRGRKGGVRLSRPPSQITIGEVLRSTEPGFCLVECIATPGSCSLERVCGVPTYLHSGMHAFLAVMDGAKLSDVICTSVPPMASRASDIERGDASTTHEQSPPDGNFSSGNQTVAGRQGVRRI